MTLFPCECQLKVLGDLLVWVAVGVWMLVGIGIVITAQLVKD